LGQKDVNVGTETKETAVMRLNSAALVCLLLMSQGCTRVSPTPAQKLAEMHQSMERIAQSVPGRVGAAVRLLETSETVTITGDERFPMQSVYKMPIAMAVLHDVDVGRLQIDASITVDQSLLHPESLYSPIRDKFPNGTRLTVRELIRYAVSESDNVACDILLDLAGGPERVTAYLRSLGLHEVAVAATEREMGVDNAVQYRNWATPRGAVEILAVFHRGAGLSVQSRAILTEAMTATVTGPRRIKGLLPPDTPVAHKTGTSDTHKGRTAATNDIGIITLPDGRHLAVAVFVGDSPADLDNREAVIARISRAAYDCFAPPAGAQGEGRELSR
jgi:beta-lactamase class A